MKLNEDFIKFLIAARQLQDQQLLSEISTDTLENIQIEVAEDPEIEKAIKKLMQ